MLKNYDDIFIILTKSYTYEPLISKIRLKNASAFRILISTMLSARTRDETTEKVSASLFTKISTIDDLANIKTQELEKIINSVGFYKTKAKHIKKTASIILKKFTGIVPKTMEELTTLPGVGIKTASLTMIEAYDIDEICVDTHVHRISNRLNFVDTKSPEETYFKLKKTLPLKYWKLINRLMVSYGKTICKPINPLCSKCKLINFCSFYKNANKII